MISCVFSAIIITGGNPTKRSVEVLHSNGQYWCSLPDLPDDRTGHTQSDLFTCGGYSSNDGGKRSCLSFSNGHWNTSHQLQTDKFEHSSWMSNQGVVLMGGYFAFESTTETLHNEGGSTTFGWIEHSIV